MEFRIDIEYHCTIIQLVPTQSDLCDEIYNLKITQFQPKEEKIGHYY